MTDTELPTGWARLPMAGDWSPTVMLADGRILRVGDGHDRPAVYDATTDRWTPTGPNILDRRRGSRSIVVTAEGWALLSGDHVVDKHLTAACELYDPASNVWREMPELPAPRFGHVCVCAHGRVYAIGGTELREQKLFHQAMASWAPGDPEWRIEPDLPVDIQTCIACVLADGSIVVWGTGRESLHWDHERWHVIDRICPCAAVLPLGDGLVEIGGQHGAEAIARVRTWTAAGGWKNHHDLPLPRTKAAAVRLVDGRIAVIGGHFTERQLKRTPVSSGWEFLVHHHDHVLVGELDDWHRVPAPPRLFGLGVHALRDGRVMVASTPHVIWTPGRRCGLSGFPPARDTPRH